MNTDENISELLKKFILGQCSPGEVERIVAFFKERGNTNGVPSVEDLSEILEEIPEIEESTADRIYNRIIDKGQKKAMTPPKIKRRIRHPESFGKLSTGFSRGVSAAAVIAGVLAIGFGVWQNSFFPPEDRPTDFQEKSVTLELDNGQIIIMEPENSARVTDARGHVVGKQDKGRLVYMNPSGEGDSLVYNTLKVPYGKRFDLVLSDGTTVYLNAGTSLRYPVKFIEGEERQVFLTGEAFFEVTEDKKRPFTVNTGELHVKVFGTRFNVSAYPEDRATDVVLVEGSVGMYEGKGDKAAKKGTLLTPGHKGSFDRREKTIVTGPVPTRVYTSWIEGELVFRNMTFENIMKKLERHYNIPIVIRNEALAKEEFNASFGRQPVEKVLEYLKMTYGIDYTLGKEKITIE